jgi:MSHA biogenesis protein MshJ
MTARPRPARPASSGPGLALADGPSRWRDATTHLRWRALQRRFDQCAERERLLMIGAALALTLMLANWLWLSPALTAFTQARAEQTTAAAALAILQADVLALQHMGSTQTRTQQADLTRLRQRVRDGDDALRRHEDTLVGPDHMVGLLEQLLARQGQVRVRAMRSLGRADLLNPSTPDKAQGALAAAGAATADAAAPSLYRHGVELVLEGGFADLLQYLRAVEALPQRVLWGSVSLKVEQHPKSVLTLRIYTISRDRHWLEI